MRSDAAFRRASIWTPSSQSRANRFDAVVPNRAGKGRGPLGPLVNCLVEVAGVEPASEETATRRLQA